MVITIFVHEIDTELHPGVRAGWRWAVHLGGNPTDLNQCVTAASEATPQEAMAWGELVAGGVARALHLATGLAPTVHAQVLTEDPVPPGVDLMHVLQEG